MTEAQIQLQNALTTTFFANLAFLSEYDNALYHRVDELSRIIENGTYEEKYALEFIMESGDFDIYDIVNNKYLYNKNPKKVNNDLVRKVEFDSKNAIFNIEQCFLTKKPKAIDFGKRFFYEDSSEFSLLTQNKVFEYSNSLNDFLDNKKKKLKEIKKFIFLGTLLGRHIPRIAEKIDAKMYLVLERNLEIFRLSLFTVDYTILANNGVIFSIMEDNLQEIEKINKFIDIGYLDNHVLKFSTTNINIERYVDNILTYLVSLKPTMYDYNRYLYVKINRTTKILGSGYKTLFFDHIQKTNKFFEKHPILYIAAGPSLDDNIEWIKQHQNNFFIVTIGAAYKKLIKNNIRIDMITTLDEDSILAKTQFDDENISKINKDTIILANCATNPKILEKFKFYNLYLFETQIALHKDNIAFSGFSIGEITADILLKMNAKEIYFIGLDLALNQETGLTHSKDSGSYLKSYDLNENDDRSFFSLNKGVIKVKGNLKDEVSTTAIFYNSIESLNGKLKNKKKDVKIYNLSSHGAYFENTIPKKIEDIDVESLIDLNLDKKELLNILNKNSLTTLSKKSKEKIINEISFLKKIIEPELKEFTNKEYEFYKEFQKEYLKILVLIQNYKASFIYHIINDYSKIIFPYLSFHFNDIKIKNESKKIKKIKGVLVSQIKDILNDYIVCLERIIK
jgi:hypothetical protein